MNLLHIRFGNTLSALLAHARDRQKRFRRLLRDRPTDIRVTTRTKYPEADLKLGYRRRLIRASAASALLFLATYLLYPEYILTVRMGAAPAPAVIQVQQIPETTQHARAPAPPRPSVPLAVEGEDVPDDVTIESTELDLDNMPIAPGLGVPGAIGPPSDEPLEISEIDYKPHPIRIVAPEYPELARKSKQEGEVSLRVLVGKDGQVETVEIISGPDIFRKAAVTAAWQFRFRPGKHEGQRRKVWMLMPIEFKLQ